MMANKAFLADGSEYMSLPTGPPQTGTFERISAAGGTPAQMPAGIQFPQPFSWVPAGPSQRGLSDMSPAERTAYRQRILSEEHKRHVARERTREAGGGPVNLVFRGLGGEFDLQNPVTYDTMAEAQAALDKAAAEGSPGAFAFTRDGKIDLSPSQKAAYFLSNLAETGGEVLGEIVGGSAGGSTIGAPGLVAGRAAGAGTGRVAGANVGRVIRAASDIPVAERPGDWETYQRAQFGIGAAGSLAGTATEAGVKAASRAFIGSALRRSRHLNIVDYAAKHKVPLNRESFADGGVIDMRVARHKSVVEAQLPLMTDAIDGDQLLAKLRATVNKAKSSDLFKDKDAISELETLLRNAEQKIGQTVREVDGRVEIVPAARLSASDVDEILEQASSTIRKYNAQRSDRNIDRAMLPKLDAEQNAWKDVYDYGRTLLGKQSPAYAEAKRNQHELLLLKQAYAIATGSPQGIAESIRSGVGPFMLTSTTAALPFLPLEKILLGYGVGGSLTLANTPRVAMGAGLAAQNPIVQAALRNLVARSPGVVSNIAGGAQPSGGRWTSYFPSTTEQQERLDVAYPSVVYPNVYQMLSNPMLVEQLRGVGGPR